MEILCQAPSQTVFILTFCHVTQSTCHVTETYHQSLDKGTVEVAKACNAKQFFKRTSSTILCITLRSEKTYLYQ